MLSFWFSSCPTSSVLQCYVLYTGVALKLLLQQKRKQVQQSLQCTFPHFFIVIILEIRIAVVLAVMVHFRWDFVIFSSYKRHLFWATTSFFVSPTRKKYEDPPFSRRSQPLARLHPSPSALGSQGALAHSSQHPPAHADPAVSDSHLVPPERSLYLLTLKDKHEDILPSTHRSHSQGAQPPLPPPPPPPPFPPQTHICTCTPPLPTQRRLWPTHL